MTATGAIAEAKPASTRSKRRRKVPDYLVKDEIDGVKFYYRGYKEVLNKTKQPEEIMGCSSLQSLILSYLLELLYQNKATGKYRVFAGESGNHLAKRTNLQFDIALYDKTALPGDKISRRYVQSIPPRLVVEIDLEVEWDEEKTQNYLVQKTEKLLDFGVKKVIWILTAERKVVVAEPGNPWQIHDWATELELLDSIYFNIANHLAAEGVDPDAE